MYAVIQEMLSVITVAAAIMLQALPVTKGVASVQALLNGVLQLIPVDVQEIKQ
jgi:hypothetical protein